MRAVLCEHQLTMWNLSVVNFLVTIGYDDYLCRVNNHDEHFRCCGLLIWVSILWIAWLVDIQSTCFLFVYFANKPPARFILASLARWLKLSATN